jgi:hypothetical protein
MANRNWKRDRGALTRGLIDLFANVAIGATGAPTLTVASSEGIKSIARNSAGKYTITLQDQYSKGLKAFDYFLLLASGAPASSANPAPVIRADNSAAAAKTVVLEFLDNTGAAIELTSGVVLSLNFVLKNS